MKKVEYDEILLIVTRKRHERQIMVDVISKYYDTIKTTDFKRKAFIKDVEKMLFNKYFEMSYLWERISHSYIKRFGFQAWNIATEKITKQLNEEKCKQQDFLEYLQNNEVK